MESHPYADIFPLMGYDELRALADDIENNGQRAPVILLDGQILDGRNRWRACELALVEPKTRDFTGNDPLEFVISANLCRRHLNESQRAMVAAKLANLPHGRPNKGANLPLCSGGQNKGANLPSITPVPLSAAAKHLNVSTRSAKDAKKVLSVPAQQQAVELGEKRVSVAAKEIRKAESDKEVQRDETGYAVPPDCMELWHRRGEVREVLSAISKLRGVIRTAMQSDDPLWQPSSPNGILGRLNECYTSVLLSLPHAVCPTCQGRAKEDCASCKGRGFVSEHHFKVCVPIEIKQIREKSCVKK